MNVRTLSSPHPFVAWFFDLWLLSGVAALVPVKAPERLTVIVIVAWLAVLAGSLRYHLHWAERTRFLTFGEFVAGRAFAAGRKTWSNPYPCSRVPLYLVIGMLLLVRTVRETPNEGEPFIRAAGMAVAVVSLLLVGRGIAAGLLGLWLARVVDYSQTWSVDHVLRPALPLNGPQSSLVAFGILCLAVAAGYTWLVVRASRSRREAAAVP